MLSTKQIATIDHLVRDAYALQESLGLVVLPGDLDGASRTARRDFWRRQQLGVCVGKSSYRDCHPIKSYLPIKAHFQRLAGQQVEAERTRQREEYGSDLTHTNACVTWPQIIAAAHEAGYVQAQVGRIMAAKFAGETDPRQLSQAQLYQLLYTLRNRSSAKRNVGEARNRNKKQRQPSQD